MNKKIVSIIIIGVFFNLCLISIVSANSLSVDKEEILSKTFDSFKIKFLANRFFLYQKPASSSPENGYPVIFVFHGAIQHAFSWFLPINPWNKQQNMFVKDALEKGFFVIAPESQRPFIIGPRAWDSFRKDISDNKDLRFIQNIIDYLNSSNLPVDMNNIFAAGFSSGGFMCSRIGYSLGSQFNALSVHSGVNAESIKITIFGPVFDCETNLDLPETHPPTIIVHGEKDPIVPVECTIHFYNELVRLGIDADILIDPDGEHIWLSQFNNQILGWFENYLAD